MTTRTLLATVLALSVVSSGRVARDTRTQKQPGTCGAANRFDAAGNRGCDVHSTLWRDRHVESKAERVAANGAPRRARSRQL